MLRRFRFLCVVFFVSYVNVFLSHSACFFFARFSFAFRTVYISVSLFHVHLVLVYRPCSRFPESDFQHLVSRLLYRLFCIFLLVFTLCSLLFCSDSFYVYFQEFTLLTKES